MRRYIIASLFCIITYAGFSQKYMIERFRLEDGLPSDIVKSLAMDSAGFIWVGTDDGIAKLQGKDIIKVEEPDLISDNYKDILLTKKYGLLASVDGGLLKISQNHKGISADFLKKKILVPDSLKFIYLKTLYESKDSSVWVSDAQNVYRIKNNNLTTYNFPEQCHTQNFIRSYQFFEVENRFMTFSETGYLYEFKPNTNTFNKVSWEFEGANIYDVHKINNHQFLIGCSKGLLQINFNNGKINKITDLQAPYPILVIAELSITKLVVGTWFNGVYKVDISQSKPIYNLIEETKSEYIPDILIDKQKQIWIASSSGVFLIRNLSFNVEVTTPSYKTIENIILGNDSLLYFNDENSIYSTSNKGVRKLFYELKNDKITSIASCKNGLLIGTESGDLICKYFNGNSTHTNLNKSGTRILSIVVDKNSNTWLIQQQKQETILLKIDTNGNIKELTPKLANGAYLSFLKLSPQGELYIGSKYDKSYLYKYDYKKQQVVNISLTVVKLYTEPVEALDITFIDKDTFLLATPHGIIKQTPQQAQHYDLGPLANEVITAITIDKEKRIWFSTIKGIICADNEIISVYNNADGLASKVSNLRCLVIDSSNYLWVCSNILQACKIPEKFKQSSKPTITSIKQSGEEIKIKNSNEFLQNTLLNIFFASPDYSSKYIEYQYSINRNNAEDNWIDIKNGNNNIFFDYLEKGNYTLKIRAKNKGHYIWSEPAIYNFDIYKIWYTRPEIIIGINLFLFLLAYLYYRNNRIKSIRKRKELEEIITERTQEIVEQNKQLVKTQKQLIQSEKMASIGLLTAGIAHEINNPINYVNGGITVLKKSYAKLSKQLLAYKSAYETSNSTQEKPTDLPSENQIKSSFEITDDMFETIEEGISKTKKIVHGIRTFSSNSENVFAKFDINESLDSVVLMLYSTLKNRITIEKDYEQNIQIIGVSSNVQQIFMNIIANAAQAIENEGTIFIKTSLDSLKKNIIISIKDTGVGMSEEVQNKIFDPFFSTKDVGEGTGLGLYLTYQYVEQHFGKITVHSEIDKGTEFIITLPIKH